MNRYCVYGKWRTNDTEKDEIIGYFLADSVAERGKEARNLIKSLSNRKRRKYDSYLVSKVIRIELAEQNGSSLQTQSSYQANRPSPVAN